MDSCKIPRETIIRACKQRLMEHEATLARLPWWRVFARHEAAVRRDACFQVLGQQLLACEERAGGKDGK